MRILMTSFGPFNNFKTNPSNEIMERLKQKLSFSSPAHNYYKFETIEVSWSSVSTYIENQKNETFDFIFHLGVATNESNIRIETTGQNIQSGNDVENNAPTENQIIPNEPDLHTNISVERLKNFVLKNENIKISHDAGAYLCNYLYFKSLYFLGKESAILFIHTADTQNQPEAPSIELQTEIIYNLINSLTNNTPENSTSGI